MKETQIISPHNLKAIDIRGIGSFSNFSALIAFIYVCLYPPFISNGLFNPVYRLVLETLVLVCLLAYSLWKTKGKIQVNLLYGTILLVTLLLFNKDNPKNTISFFNKLIFFILLCHTFDLNYRFYETLRRLWILLFFYCSIAACLAFLVSTSGFLPLRPFDGILSYNYLNHPLLGNVIPKSVGGITLPRFTGWFKEPGFIAAYFGINLYLADYIVKRKWSRLFRRLNLLGGILTLSFSFYAIIFGFFLYNRGVPKIFKNKFFITLIIIALFSLVYYVWQNPHLVSFSSFVARAWRYEEAYEIAKKMDVIEIIVGMGVLPFYEALGGGGASGILDIVFSRGLLVTAFVIHMIYRKTVFQLRLFVFIVLYSLFFDLFAFPLLYLGLALGYRSARKLAGQNKIIRS
jgi:hypothetical protein